jgi:hypothetical protein
MTIWPVDHHKVGPILGQNIAKYKDKLYGRRSAEIESSKLSPRGVFQVIFHCKYDTFASSSPW